MKKKYIPPKIGKKKINALMLRSHSFLDSYNSLAGTLLATYPGCGHSCDVPSSDIRLKKNIKEINNVLVKLIKLKCVTFNFKNQLLDKKNIGLIAQDLEKNYPELVYTDNKGYKNIEYSKLTVLLISAVKELTKRVETLEQKNKG